MELQSIASHIDTRKTIVASGEDQMLVWVEVYGDK